MSICTKWSVNDAQSETSEFCWETHLGLYTIEVPHGMHFELKNNKLFQFKVHNIYLIKNSFLELINNDVAIINGY